MKKYIQIVVVFIILICNFDLLNVMAINGDIAYRHLLKFSLIGSRALVTQSEINSRNYIEKTLKDLGYEVDIHKFDVDGYETANIEVNKKGLDSSKVIILGAHYDGRIEGNAFDDNASGIATLLELCEIFRNTQTHYDLKFIFFGAEEINLLGRGLHGSYNYVESLSDSDKEKIKYMINLDTLLSGDNMYVYNVYKDEKIDEIDNIFLQKLIEVAQNMEIDIMINPRDGEELSFTNTKSDYYPFFEVGIPVLYCESTNWNVGETDGRTQTEMCGRIIHTPMDNMNFLENFFDERIREHLVGYISLIKEFILTGI